MKKAADMAARSWQSGRREDGLSIAQSLADRRRVRPRPQPPPRVSALSGQIPSHASTRTYNDQPAYELRAAQRVTYRAAPRPAVESQLAHPESQPDVPSRDPAARHASAARPSIVAAPVPPAALSADTAPCAATAAPGASGSCPPLPSVPAGEPPPAIAPRLRASPAAPFARVDVAFIASRVSPGQHACPPACPPRPVSRTPHPAR